MDIDKAFIDLEETFRFILNNNNLHSVNAIKIIQHAEKEKMLFSKEYFEKVLSVTWTHEKPELEWISKATILFASSNNFPIESISTLLQSCIYYGFHDIIRYIMQNIPQNLPFENQCNIYKHQAKYFKNIGDLKQAQIIYRQAISFSCDNNREDYIAFFIMLYAKLCQDHLQRVGLYVSFHDIAYHRLQRCLKQEISGQIIRKEKLNLWIEISKDTYAKAIYQNFPVKADKIFTSLQNQFSDTERKFRIEFRKIECKINYLLDNIKDFNKIPKLINKYYELTLKIDSHKNIKASYIRNIHFARLLRKIKENSKDILPNKYYYDNALDKLKDAKRKALMFSDTRMAAEAIIEIALWEKNQIIASKKDLNSQLYNKILNHLHEAENILKKNRNVDTVITSTYFDTLNILAINYLESGNWDKSLEYYEKLYDYVGFLIKSVGNDEKEITIALNSKKSKKNTVVLPEFIILTKAELTKLKEQIVIDYKLLLDKLYDYKEKIRHLSNKQIHFQHEKIMLTHRSFSHDLATIANNMERIINDIEVDGLVKNKILNENKQIINKCKEWEKSIGNFYELSHFDVIVFLTNYVAHNYFLKNTIKVQLLNEKTESLLIYFNEKILGAILDNIVSNIIQAGQRGNIININIGFKVCQETSYKYLCINDNVGDFDFLKKNIDNINSANGNSVKLVSKRSSINGGSGLINVRKNIFILTRIDSPWILEKIDNDTKILKIPFQNLRNE